MGAVHGPGLSNFTFLVKSMDLSLLVRNTLLYNLAFIILGTILSVTVAILLNEVQRKKLPADLFKPSSLFPT